MSVHNFSSYAATSLACEVPNAGLNHANFRFWGSAGLSLAAMFIFILATARSLSSWALVPGVAIGLSSFCFLVNKSGARYLVPGPGIRVAGRRLLGFQLFSGAGLAIGVAINLGLGAHFNLPLRMSVIIAALGILMIPVEAIVIKMITGKEELWFYHAVISVPTTTTIVLWLSGQPILPFLDALLISMGAARAVGYFGCLMAGCCHGRAARWGVVYTERYAHVLPPNLLNVTLFPIQIVEALWTSGTTIIGCILMFKPHAPGAGLAWFIMTYCPARFCFEWWRWPANYQFRSGLSPHQWISVSLALLIVGLGFAGVLPFQLWHAVVLICLLLITAALVVERRLRSFNKQLNHPEHLRELRAAIDLALRNLRITNHDYRPAFTFPPSCTSLGLQVTAGKIASESGEVHHFALSSKNGLTAVTAKSLAQAIVRLRNLAGPVELLEGSGGVFHLLVHPARSEGS